VGGRRLSWGAGKVSLFFQGFKKTNSKFFFVFGLFHGGGGGGGPNVPSRVVLRWGNRGLGPEGPQFGYGGGK